MAGPPKCTENATKKNSFRFMTLIEQYYQSLRGANVYTIFTFIVTPLKVKQVITAFLRLLWRPFDFLKTRRE